nr:zinc knuckle CX2CX4HX4C [Tanacetum cinerariifolium]
VSFFICVLLRVAFVMDNQPDGECSTSNNAMAADYIDEITKLFGVSLRNPKDIDVFTNSNTSVPSHESPIVQAVDINKKQTSYAGAVGASTKDQPKVCSNFLPLVANLVFDGVNIFIHRKVFEKGGPWLIRKSPIILKKWSMDTRLLKEELTRIPIWVKLHDVPIKVFEEDDISLIATFIGKPIMLDSYTSSMCNDSWGRSSFAQCLIKVNSEVDLVDVVTVGIPSLTGEGFTKETIRVEYEWRPPKCDICKIFGHVHDHCPNKMVSPPIVTTLNVVAPTVVRTNDGFQTVGTKKKKKEEDDDEVVENVYDESANIFTNSQSGGSSSFIVVAG